jgi:rhodanese-related sulfurtransferase
MNLALQTLLRANDASLSPELFKDLLAHGGQLVDIRSPADFRRGALPGALNLPLDALVYDYDHLDKQGPVILYGATEGVQCSRAAHLLAGRGFSRIYHLSGT